MPNTLLGIIIFFPLSNFAYPYCCLWNFLEENILYHQYSIQNATLELCFIKASMQPVWEKAREKWDESLNSYHGDLASRSQATANQTLQFQASYICPCKIKRLNCVSSVFC